MLLVWEKLIRKKAVASYANLKCINPNCYLCYASNGHNLMLREKKILIFLKQQLSEYMLGRLRMKYLSQSADIIWWNTYLGRFGFRYNSEKNVCEHHFMSAVQASLKAKIDAVLNPKGCTKYIQATNWNKPFKTFAQSNATISFVIFEEIFRYLVSTDR